MEDERENVDTNSTMNIEKHPVKQLGESKTTKLGPQLPWIEKYRPKSLKELIAHEQIVSTIQKLIDANRLPHLLFYGPPGTGKTSTILAVARQIFGKNLRSMVLELNASDARGIDTVKNDIQTFASTRKLFSTGIKLIVLDEADNMTNDAQMALRRIIEKYTKNCRFCLICNYASKIIPALQSRCTRFRFAPLKREQILSRMQYVIEQENVNITPDGFDAVLNLAGGDMRRVLNILQSAALAYPEVTSAAVYSCVGKPTEDDVQVCLDALLNMPFKKAFRELERKQTEKGLAIVDILTEIFYMVAKINMPKEIRCFLMKEMAEIEYRLAFATSEKLQLAALVGVFYLARQGLQDSEKMQVE